MWEEMMERHNRYAIVYRSERHEVEPYLPDNYEIVGQVLDAGRLATIIAGQDVAGWTLDSYVIPRLQSGLRFAAELEATQ